MVYEDLINLKSFSLKLIIFRLLFYNCYPLVLGRNKWNNRNNQNTNKNNDSRVATNMNGGRTNSSMTWTPTSQQSQQVQQHPISAQPPVQHQANMGQDYRNPRYPQPQNGQQQRRPYQNGQRQQGGYVQHQRLVLCCIIKSIISNFLIVA